METSSPIPPPPASVQSNRTLGSISEDLSTIAPLDPDVVKAYDEWSVPTSLNLSLKQKVKRLVDQGPLRPADVVDFGPIPPEGRKRYRLKHTYRSQVTVTLQALQRIINVLAAKVPHSSEESPGYEVVPSHDLMLVLDDAHSLAQLSGDWEILQERMERGARFVEKYYRAHKGERIGSPVTTDPRIYETMAVGDIDTLYKQYRTQVPSMWKGAPWSSPDRKAFLESDLEELIVVDRKLKDAFPPQAESNAKYPYSYSETTNERKDMSYLLRSSIGNPNLRLPSIPKKEPKGKERERTAESARRRDSRSTEEEEEVRNSVLTSPKDAADISVSTAIPGAFPAPMDFMKGAPVASAVTTTAGRTLGRDEENIVFGMGKETRGLFSRRASVGESISTVQAPTRIPHFQTSQHAGHTIRDASFETSMSRDPTVSASRTITGQPMAKETPMRSFFSSRYVDYRSTPKYGERQP
ncbi:hypothetical protein NLI96_g13214 [Meripilus lineatus]|uniref:Uncharacterized protein n=1 Tax=Meripilus lineatus TaxID=2056292 RepID=A0AAD5UNH7_9APHY|nr:hypothetical protein NLI96_g13214 [Physisporinus lineatus]